MMASSGAPVKINHSPEFRFRRMQNWLTLGLTYAAMYMARYNFPFANKALSDKFGWDKAQVGAIITTATLVYGISAMFNGPIADKIGGRRAMLIGASGALVFNLLFGMGAYLGAFGEGSVLLTYLATMWTLNMYFQSYSALALIKVNSGWFHVGERGVFSAIFGSMIQSGRAAVFALLTAGLVVALPWQWKFFLPAIVLAIFATLTFLVVRDSPEDAGLAPFDPEDATSGDTDKVTFAYVAKKIFTNPVTLTIAAAEFCTGFVRHGFEQWFPRFMQEVYGLSQNDPRFQKSGFAIVAAGILGAFVAGYLSDLIFKARRAPVAFVGYAIQIVCLTTISFGAPISSALGLPADDLTLITAAFMLNSLGISMVHSMLSGTASMDFGGKKAAGTAAGFFDGMQYVGGSFVGIGVGALLDNYGWGAWGFSMIVPASLGAILMIPLWNQRPKSSRKAKPVESSEVAGAAAPKTKPRVSSPTHAPGP